MCELPVRVRLTLRLHRSTCSFLLWCGLSAAALSSCQGNTDPYTIGAVAAVTGNVFVDGKPLPAKPNGFARVWFHPDKSKGNCCPQVACGNVDSRGNYQLATRGRTGVPPGWYKVMIIATEHVDQRNPKKKRPSFVPAKYGNPETSGLRVHVVESPAPGQYDLRLKN